MKSIRLSITRKTWDSDDTYLVAQGQVFEEDGYKAGEMVEFVRKDALGEWIPISEKLAPRHETVLALSSEGDVYQARVCYGMHAPFWCGHSKLNFGKVLADEGIVITHWRALLSTPGSDK
jgi:hypothetical protein